MNDGEKNGRLSVAFVSTTNLLEKIHMLNKILLIIVCSCIGITSCTTVAPTEQATATPQATAPVIPTPNTSPTSTQPPTVTIAALATPTTFLPATATPTLQATPTAISVKFESRTCTTAPQFFDYRQEFGIGGLFNLQFEGDNSLTFNWWSDGPEPEVTPTTPNPTPDMMPAPYVASRLLLENGELDLLDGQFRLYPLNVDPIFDNPCKEECPADVIGQSPDRKWQLVRVADWILAEQGIWLMSEDEAIRLDPFGHNPEWKWANDSSLLWLRYSNPHDSNGEILLVELDSPIVVKDAITQGLLNTFDYWLAFSPLDKTAQTIPAFAGTVRSEEALLELDLMSSPIRISETRSIPDIFAIKWNEATQSFLVHVAKEDRVVFQDIYGNVMITIPQSTLVPLFPELVDGISISNYNGSREYALSESGRYLAFQRNTGGILVFDCGEEEIDPATVKPSP